MTKQRILRFLSACGISALALGCEVTDADLDETGLAAFSVTPAATDVDVLQVGVTGQATLAYLSEDDATLEIFVNGQSAYSESLDASAELELDFSATLALAAGPNEIVAELSYNGNELGDTFVVNVDPPDPIATFPDWSTAFTQTGTVNIAMNGDWAVEEVAYSVDQGEFLPAIAGAAAGDFDLALENLDIGDSSLTVRVRTSNAGFQQEHLFHDVVQGIVPVFDCSQTSSMLPTTDLLRDNRTEIRSMLGYFGDPDGGHTLTFVIEFVDDNGDRFVNPAAVLTKGRSAVDVEFSVDQFRCNNNPCNERYDLALLVDGQQHCSQTSYGDIFEL